MFDKTDPAKAIKAVLTDKLHIDLKENPIKVEQEGDDILIDGFVDNISQKKRALFIAMGTDGVNGIIDRLRVKPSSTMSDDQIKNHISNAFEEEQTLRGLGLKAAVTEAIVDLEGKAPSLSHKRLAGALAWWVPGVVDVINSIEIDPPEDDNDDEITDALRLLLEKDRLVDSSEIKVTTRNWVVTLEGVARTEAEKDAAEEDAWYVWGVNEVVNKIQVESTGGSQLT